MGDESRLGAYSNTIAADPGNGAQTGFEGTFHRVPAKPSAPRRRRKIRDGIAETAGGTGPMGTFEG